MKNGRLGDRKKKMLSNRSIRRDSTWCFSIVIMKYIHRLPCILHMFILEVIDLGDTKLISSEILRRKVRSGSTTDSTDWIQQIDQKLEHKKEKEADKLIGERNQRSEAKTTEKDKRLWKNQMESLQEELEMNSKWFSKKAMAKSQVLTPIQEVKMKKAAAPFYLRHNHN